MINECYGRVKLTLSQGYGIVKIKLNLCEFRIKKNFRRPNLN